MTAPKAVKSDDYAVRAAVVRVLLADGIARENIRHELTLNTSSSGGRADIVVLLTHRIVGIELKSAKDTLDRCELQARQYKAAFDQAFLVADRRFVPPGEYGKHPRYFGNLLVYFEGKIVNEYENKPVSNILSARWNQISQSTSAKRMGRLLWKVESDRAALALGCKAYTREANVAAMAEHASLRDIRALVAAELRAREFNKWEAAFWRRFDAETEAAATVAA